MDFNTFQNEVNKAISAIEAIKSCNGNGAWALKYIDIDIYACECAAEITCHDDTIVKMLLNKKFRDDAINLSFDLAVKSLN